jgi:hypothetical protein
MDTLKSSAESVVEKAKETTDTIKPKLEQAYETAKPVVEKILNEYPQTPLSLPFLHFYILPPLVNLNY